MARWELLHFGILPTTVKYGRLFEEEPKNNVIMVDNKILKLVKVVAHKFSVDADVDVLVYAAEPIIQWQRSEQGAWVMERAVCPPVWHRFTQPVTLQEQFAIVATLTDSDATFFKLKWGEIK